MSELSEGRGRRVQLLAERLAVAWSLLVSWAWKALRLMLECLGIVGWSE